MSGNLETDLRNARTVSIVIHGVGDHTASEIIEDAKKYLQTQTRSVEVAERELDGFPSPLPGNPRRQPVLEMSVDGVYHYVIPVAWSEFRLRTSYFMGKYSLHNPIVALVMSIPAMLALCLDALRCVPRAQGHWKLGILAVCGLILAIVLALVRGAYFVMFRSAGMFPVLHALPGYHWYNSFILVGTLFGFAMLMRRSAALLDFMGDVAAYIANDTRRLQLERAFDAILLRVAESAPEARIAAIGHSLGTVLVSHSLLKIGPEHSASRRTILATLGSPLVLMSRMFPGSVRAPASLLRSYGESGSILFWANLWRDSDFIGRSLGLRNAGRYAEKSLGPGPHWGMWSDERVWHAVVRVLGISDGQSVDGIAAEWEPSALTQEESSEFTWRKNTIVSGGQLLTASLIGLGASVPGLFWQPVTRLAGSPALCAALGALWIIGFELVIVLANVWTRIMAPSTSERALLGRLRLMRTPFTLMVILTFGAVVVLMLFTWAGP